MNSAVRDATRDLIEAARCIRHWHDKIFPDGSEGMVVSGEHVRNLWQALADYDEATAHSQREPLSTSEESTSWRSQAAREIADKLKGHTGPFAIGYDEILATLDRCLSGEP